MNAKPDDVERVEDGGEEGGARAGTDQRVNRSGGTRNAEASRNNSRGAPHALWIVVAAAFAGALGESALRFASRVLLDRPTFLNPQSVWLGPLLNIAVLAVPVAIVYGVGRPERRPARLAFFGVLYVTLELALLLSRVALWAKVLLALGLATEVARRVARHPAMALRFARGIAVVLVASSLILGVAVNATRSVSERRSLAALPAPRVDAPDVVLVVLDAVRAASMGLYGGPAASTPFLTRFASRCVNYRNAIATASWTLPSHGSMLTGRWPRELSADWAVPLNDRFSTLAERMAARGYATGAAVGNYLYTYYEFGLSRGFAHYDDYGISVGEAANRSAVGDHLARTWNSLTNDYIVPGRKMAGRVNKDILTWIDAQQGRPYFAFLNWYDAHDPYSPPGRWRHAFAPIEPPTRAVPPEAIRGRLDSATVIGLRNAYLGAVGYLDSELESLVQELQRRGTLDRTLLIITSDHGEEFAEHGWLQHGYTLYYPAVHVPLIICAPTADSLGGRTVEIPVSLRDLSATMLAAVGGGSPGDTLPGHDLLALARWAPTDTTRPCHSAAISQLLRPPGEGLWHEASTNELSSIVDGRFHLIRTDQGHEELFDVIDDPWEQRDLAGSAGLDSVLTRLRHELDRPTECRQ